MEQTELPSIQQFDNVPIIVEQLKALQDTNEYIATEPPLSVRDDSNVLLDEQEQTAADNHVESETTPASITQNVSRRSPGRPKKTGVTSQVCQEYL